MDIARERSYQTPLVNSPLLPMLILSLMRQKNAPNTAKFFQPEYDYIVVGSGSAGAVVASRLSEIPCVNVLLLEAGPSPPYITEVPGIAASFWNSDLSWTYMTVPQKFTGRLMVNRQARWLGGKVIGGSSSINFMLYSRGNRHNYDNWADAGAEGWSYKDVLPYFVKMEDNRDPDYVANGYHGVGGPLTVMRPWYHSEIKDPIFKAAKNLGYEILDSNAGRQTGFYDLQATMRDGQRCSTAKAYLVPAENRTNLDILANAFVRKVVINNGRAVGVEFDFQGKTNVVKARKEVILSAGSINTPQLLMLSGIGPKSELKKHKIPVVADLPVGQNLQNHAAMAIYFELSPTIESAESKLSNPRYILEYIKNRSGPLGSDEMMSAFAWAKIDQVRPNVDLPDYDLLFAEGILFEEGLYPEVAEQVYGPYERKPIFGCVADMIQPRSRGTVTLNSTDPYDPPIVDPRYFEDPRDIDAIVDGLKVCNRIGSSPEFKALGSVPIQTVFPGCEPFVGDEEAMYRCMIESFVIVYPHQSGTARMGNPNDPKTVVDPQLRVKGVQGLRIADASVMPFVPSDGPNVPAIMVGEKLSDMIKATIQCNSYRRDKDWWHGSDNSRWTEQKHYQSPSHSESHIPSNIY